MAAYEVVMAAGSRAGRVVALPGPGVLRAEQVFARPPGAGRLVATRFAWVAAGPRGGRGAARSVWARAGFRAGSVVPVAGMRPVDAARLVLVIRLAVC